MYKLENCTFAHSNYKIYTVNGIPKEIVINHKKRKEVINMSSEKRFLNAKEIAELLVYQKKDLIKS